MTVRKMQESDLTFIADCKKDFSDGWNYQMLASSFATGRFYGFIAEDGGTPVAFLTYSFLRPDADIESVFVKTEYRRKGIAGALIIAAEKEIKNGGGAKIFLEVRESNYPAKKLYAENGFGKISVRKKYYGTEDAEIFLKEI